MPLSVKGSRILLGVSVLVPGVILGMAAWLDYQAAVDRAREYVLTTANALAEQAKGVLQTANLLLGRTLDRIDDMDWQEIGRSREVHEFLAKLIKDLPEVQSVFLVDPEGFNSVSSRAFPMERFDNREREYYRETLKEDDRLFVAATFAGQMTGRLGFTISRPRIRNGRFDGMAVVTFSPAYFQDFYETISLAPQASTAALVRTDGKLLVRYPHTDPAFQQLPEDSPLLRAAASGGVAGVFYGASSIDGHQKVAAFRRVDGQPLLANYAVERRAYLAEWYRQLVWKSAFALITAVALVATSLIVLRRTAAERKSMSLLLEESERRKEAEEKVQHLQKMEALGRLSGGVAHDFNNLLSAILGSLELALKRLEDVGRTRRLIGTAVQAAQRGARLTSQMLAFSRNRDVAPQALDVNPVIRETEDLLHRTVDALVQITYDLDDTLWLAVADRVQLEVALLNLAGNARDAMPLGGKLVISTQNRKVTQTDDLRLTPGDYVQISVTDTGEGMTEEVLARAFDPFFTTKSVGKGTGLGLSQVYGFAEQLGGMAGISSTPGEGTTVTIWLPRAASAGPPQETAESDQPVSVAPVKILLVDDDAAVRSLTGEMLGDLGHEITMAESGAAALVVLRSGMTFDMLLSDFAMPLMNGVQLAAEVIKIRPALPILFMTGFADTEVLKPWMERGYRTVTKPFSTDDLSLAISQTLAKSRTNAATLPNGGTRPSR